MTPERLRERITTDNASDRQADADLHSPFDLQDCLKKLLLRKQPQMSEAFDMHALRKIFLPILREHFGVSGGGRTKLPQAQTDKKQD